ncbi:uncharacterized protein [Symphalangus syndactylus]|uniref:uncharacterized protein n=1 Tax=Symphalangus syndactylus TaxID=9590 RepID=UPI00300721E2
MQGSWEEPPRQTLLGWDAQSQGLKPRPDGPLPLSVNKVTGAQPGLCPRHPPLSAATSTLCRQRGRLAEEAEDVHRPAHYIRGCWPPTQTPGLVDQQARGAVLFLLPWQKGAQPEEKSLHLPGHPGHPARSQAYHGAIMSPAGYRQRHRKTSSGACVCEERKRKTPSEASLHSISQDVQATFRSSRLTRGCREHPPCSLASGVPSTFRSPAASKSPSGLPPAWASLRNPLPGC